LKRKKIKTKLNKKNGADKKNKERKERKLLKELILESNNEKMKIKMIDKRTK